MFTIHRGVNGAWYGIVTADNATDALNAARELATILATLREEDPKPYLTRAERAERAEDRLKPRGAACLDYFEANPQCTYEEYKAAGHTLNTVKWLREHRYLTSVDGAWVVNRRGELET